MEWKRRSAFVFVKARTGMAEPVFQKLASWDHTIGVFLVHWPWDVVVWFDSENIEVTHKYVTEMRSWEGVEWTSTQHVFEGYRRESYWFWDFPVCTWVKVRSRSMVETYEDLKQYDWVSTFASIPGDWDCIGLVSGYTWDEVSAHLGELKRKGYEIECFTNYQVYWNKVWEERWFPSLETCSV
jgi:hypothetical protein